MDAAMLWLTLCSTLAALASAVFAFVQARSATNSQRDAEEARNEARKARDESARLAGEANAAFIRQAEAHEEANVLKRLEMTPPDLTVQRTKNGGFRLSNTSGTRMTLEDITAAPAEREGAQSLVRLTRGNDDSVYEPGDWFDFFVAQMWGSTANSVVVTYRLDGVGESKTFKTPV